MKIGIYCELFANSTLGGREFVVAILAELLSGRGHRVELVHHVPDLIVEEFTDRFGSSPESIHLRYLPGKPPATLRNFWQQRRARAAWDRSISAAYDCFINIVHGIPVPCYAASGILMVLFPFFQPFEAWSGREIPDYGASPLWVLLRHLNYRLQWQARINSYQLKTSISKYVQRWVKRRWRFETSVLYPPTEDSFPSRSKEDVILSVGRFSGPHPTMVDKRQLEMMSAFRRMDSSAGAGWRYISLGGKGASEREGAYFKEVQQQTTDRSEARANPPRCVIGELYGKAKIFWHAAGYDNNEEVTPELSEHFGIATVDAMMCGCVPVVANKGAQPEIVEDGVSGFLWASLGELRERTEFLSANPDRLLAMSAAARERAKIFSRARFESEFLRSAQAILPDI